MKELSSNPLAQPTCEKPRVASSRQLLEALAPGTKANTSSKI